MQKPGLSIRWKLLAAFVGLIVTILLIVLISVSNIVENRIRDEINTNFNEAGKVFERIQEVRFRQLRQTAILLADIPQLKSAVTTADVATVNQLLRDELLYLLDVDPIIPDSLIPEAYFMEPDSAGLLLITDPSGMPLGQMSTSQLPTHSVADRPGITEALAFEFPEQTHIWEMENRYFNVVTVPILLQNRLIGTLSYGFPMRRLETLQLADDIGMEVSYFVHNKLIASSFENLTEPEKQNLSKQIHNATFEVVLSEEATGIDFKIGNEDWLVYIAPMQTNISSVRGITGFYAVARSLTSELATLRYIQTLITIIGIIAIIGAVFISFWLTTLITRPINLLIEGVKRVEAEDFSKEVKVTTNDEIGLLTTTFNELVKGIQERLLMLKFVSKATLDAIKQNLSHIEPGGERREVAVFFSDIRGFTSWSEKHTPEQVIDMLNTLFSFQAGIIQKHGGDVDKYVGDELVAVFMGDDKEQKAVIAAAEIQREITQYLGDAHKDIAVGIGINAGDVVMGAMGSSNRMDYTVLGSNVNLGARLCSAAERGQILISDAVYMKLERRISAKSVDRIQMKGIEREINIYEVEWKKEKLTEKELS